MQTKENKTLPYQMWYTLDVIRTLGMSNQIIFYNLQIIWLLLSIDLDT